MEIKLKTMRKNWGFSFLNYYGTRERERERERERIKIQHESHKGFQFLMIFLSYKLL